MTLVLLNGWVVGFSFTLDPLNMPAKTDRLLGEVRGNPMAGGGGIRDGTDVRPQGDVPNKASE